MQRQARKGVTVADQFRRAPGCRPAWPRPTLIWNPNWLGSDVGSPSRMMDLLRLATSARMSSTLPRGSPGTVMETPRCVLVRGVLSPMVVRLVAELYVMLVIRASSTSSAAQHGVNRLYHLPLSSASISSRPARAARRWRSRSADHRGLSERVRPDLSFPFPFSSLALFTMLDSR